MRVERILPAARRRYCGVCVRAQLPEVASGTATRGCDAGHRGRRGGGAMESAAKGAYVLANLAEVVERVLGFLPTKALLRAAW